MKKYNIEDLNNVENISLKNLEILNEARELISKIELFIPQNESGNNFIIENDFERAFEYGLSDDGLVNKGFINESWTDFREDRVADLKGEIYKYNNFREISKAIFNSKICDITNIYPKFNDKYLEQLDDVSNEIEADLYYCLMSRLIMGKDNYFFEQILKAYLSGGWPCGWEGNYPEGKLIVYYPKN